MDSILGRNGGIATYVKLDNIDSMNNTNIDIDNDDDLEMDFNSRKRQKLSQLEWLKYFELVQYRLNLILVINIVALPFAVVILLIYGLLTYGERLYHEPSIILQKQITGRTQWQMRYYNELDDEFDKRMILFNIKLNSINRVSFRSKILPIIGEISLFIIGSIFIILLGLSLISGNEFMKILVFGDKNILWILGILASMLVLLNSITRLSKQNYTNNYDYNYNHNYNMNGDTMALSNIEYGIEDIKRELSSLYVDINYDNIGTGIGTECDIKLLQRIDKYKYIKKIYSSNIYNMLGEIMTIIGMPYIIWKWKLQMYKHENKFRNKYNLNSNLSADIQMNTLVNRNRNININNNDSNNNSNNNHIEYIEYEDNNIGNNENNENDDIGDKDIDNIIGYDKMFGIVVNGSLFKDKEINEDKHVLLSYDNMARNYPLWERHNIILDWNNSNIVDIRDLLLQ